MDLYENIKSGRTSLSVVGLAYVGMPLAGKRVRDAAREFMALTPEKPDSLFAPMPNDEKVIIDVKSILNKGQLPAAGYRYWRL